MNPERADPSRHVVMRHSAGDSVEVLERTTQGSGSRVTDQACAGTLEMCTCGRTTYGFT